MRLESVAGAHGEQVEVVLCDADGNLFPSEEPAFEASAAVTNRLLSALGVERRYSPEELQRASVGRNFRATALDLATEHGVAIDENELERYVELERQEVTDHLARVLSPDPEVRGPLTELAKVFRLAAVSSSASRRLDVCFRATGLAELLPEEVRFSAEDSLVVPTSKPDPAIYTFAGKALGVSGARAVAVEDAPAGVQSAVAAGFVALGNVQFVPADQRAERALALRAAGAAAVLESWSEIVVLLSTDSPSAAGAVR